MLRAVIVVAAAVGAAMVSGMSVPAERPDVAVASASDQGVIDRDDFTRLGDFDGGNGNG